VPFGLRSTTQARFLGKLGMTFFLNLNNSQTASSKKKTATQVTDKQIFACLKRACRIKIATACLCEARRIAYLCTIKSHRRPGGRVFELRLRLWRNW